MVASRRGTALADIAFHHLGQKIVDGDYAPGHRVRDVDIANELRVSRTPIREAIQRLQRIGLIDISPSRYTQVAPLSPETTEHWCDFAAQQMRTTARLVAIGASEAERVQAAVLVGELHDTIGEPRAYARAYSNVYLYLLEHTANPLHASLLSEPVLAITRVLAASKSDPARAGEVRSALRDLAEAFLKSDGHAAERGVVNMHVLLSPRKPVV